MAQNVTHRAELVYDAARELLLGTVGSERFHMLAYSGGSRGHKAGVQPQVATKYLHPQAGTLSSRMATTKEVKDAQVSGKSENRSGPVGNWGRFSFVGLSRFKTSAPRRRALSTGLNCLLSASPCC